MHDRNLPFVFFLVLALAACSGGDGSANEAMANNGSTGPSAASQDANDAPRDEQKPARTPSEQDDLEIEASTTLPLRPGVYVLNGDSCENPANASFRIWNGEGLSGSATRNCRSSATKVDQASYRVENDCENTYDGSRSTTIFTIAVSGPERFGMNERSFRRCDEDVVPAELLRLSQN